jgi:hypothetical protein
MYNRVENMLHKARREGGTYLGGNFNLVVIKSDLYDIK